MSIKMLPIMDLWFHEPSVLGTSYLVDCSMKKNKRITRTTSRLTSFSIHKKPNNCLKHFFFFLNLGNYQSSPCLSQGHLKPQWANVSFLTNGNSTISLEPWLQNLISSMVQKFSVSNQTFPCFSTKQCLLILSTPEIQTIVIPRINKIFEDS